MGDARSFLIYDMPIIINNFYIGRLQHRALAGDLGARDGIGMTDRFLELKAAYLDCRAEIDSAVQRGLYSGYYLGGDDEPG